MKILIRFLLNTIPRKYLIRGSYIFRWLTQYFYKGNSVVCNICGSSYRKFLPYGYGIVRSNALCPKCLSLERHRLVWLYLNERTKFFTEPCELLHIAPEQCFEERFRKMDNLKYLTADIESPLADYKCDVQELPFAENKFDMVICNHVLEHVTDDARAMAEILRVLKPGGFAILLVPMDFNLQKTYEDPSITSQKERARHFKQYDHVRLYGQDFPDRLKKVGFVIDEENFLNGINPEIKKRLSLPAQELMYGYKKPSHS